MAEDPLPEAVIEQATQLTRWARRAAQPAAGTYRERRAELVAAHGYTARTREGATDVLVLYPDEWVVDGTVRRDRIDDLDRGIERPLSGDTPEEDWEQVWTHNRELADAVETDYGPVHGANAQALAEFASNTTRPGSNTSRARRYTSSSQSTFRGTPGRRPSRRRLSRSQSG
jgi:hypothetical protein